VSAFIERLILRVKAALPGVSEQAILNALRMHNCTLEQLADRAEQRELLLLNGAIARAPRPEVTPSDVAKALEEI
jgi:hypothetical protein